MKPLLLGLLVLAGFSAGDKEKLRAALNDSAPAGQWIYDDLDAAYTEAGRTGKPLMVVLRCVP
jgi:serine protease Do